MPVSGPVYQPTTVTYQQQPNSRWNCPMSYFTQRLTNNLNKPRCIKLIMCVVGFVVLIAGMAMLIGGPMQYDRETINTSSSNNTESTEPSETEKSSDDHGRLGVIVVGCVLLIGGILFAGGFGYSLYADMRAVTGGAGAAAGSRSRGGWLRGWRSGRTTAAGSNGGAQLGPVPAACPSTDPLVHSAQPPANDDERRNLMDNKDCLSSAEESDKMLDSEPRVIIVTGA